MSFSSTQTRTRTRSDISEASTAFEIATKLALVASNSLDMKVMAMKSQGNFQESHQRTAWVKNKELDYPLEPQLRRSMVYANKSLLIPDGKQAWLTYMCRLVRSRVCLHFLSDRELMGVIQTARKTIGNRLPPTAKNVVVVDPDLPLCHTWGTHEVATWFAEQGFPYMRQCVKANHLTGRKLVKIDANALVKMGIGDLKEIKKITSAIRTLLGIPRPNILRALARIVPYELYLHKKSRTGPKVDQLTFETFCEEYDLPYYYLIKNNHNAKISCNCSIQVQLPYGDNENDHLHSPRSSEDSSETNSLRAAPTVEFVARNAIIHNHVVQQIIDAVLACVCEDPTKRCKMYRIKSKKSKKTIESILEESFDALHLSKDNERERMEFATNVANSLVDEMMRTAEVLQDLEETELYLQKEVSVQEWEEMKAAARMFIEELFPIASILSLGDLSLESIFKQEPQFQDFVDKIIEEAKEVGGQNEINEWEHQEEMVN